MEWLNYHHLYYFWVIAREGSIAKACRVLHLAQPTVSAQLKALEHRLGHPLFERTHRKLVLTPMGKIVLSHAERIFRLGEELLDAVSDRPGDGKVLIQVGVVDAVPKPVTFAMMGLILECDAGAQVAIHEGRLDNLLVDLKSHRLDLVLSDVAPVHQKQGDVRERWLGKLPVGLVGTRAWGQLTRDFPTSLQDIPMAVPTRGSPMRRAFFNWLDEKAITPRIVAECQDAELLKRFAVEGMGLAPVNLQAVARELVEGALVQIGPELVSEQLWMLVGQRQQLNPLAEMLWEDRHPWWEHAVGVVQG